MNAVFARRSAEGLPLTLTMEQICSIAREAQFYLTPVCHYETTGTPVTPEEIEIYLSYEGVEVVSGDFNLCTSGNSVVVTNRYSDMWNSVDQEWLYEYDGSRWTRHIHTMVYGRSGQQRVMPRHGRCCQASAK